MNKEKMIIDKKFLNEYRRVWDFGGVGWHARVKRRIYEQ